MNLVLFKEKFDNYEDLLIKKRDLKQKFPNWIHTVSIEKNEITTTTVDSYIENCIQKQLYIGNSQNRYDRTK